MTTEQLPIFKGWSVDVHLRQFRRVNYEKQEIEFLDFDEEEGDDLLALYVDTLNEENPKDARILEQILSVMTIN